MGRYKDDKNSNTLYSYKRHRVLLFAKTTNDQFYSYKDPPDGANREAVGKADKEGATHHRTRTNGQRERDREGEKNNRGNQRTNPINKIEWPLPAK